MINQKGIIMPKLRNQTKKGFTIIEVVLVLAVAGLIFLMVFIAFPALQRAQQDTQRTDDMARVQSQLISWQSNHSNNLPSASANTIDIFDGSTAINDVETGEMNDCSNTSKACQFIRDYMNAASTAGGNSSNSGTNLHYNTFKDPSGEYYSIAIFPNISKSGTDIPSLNYTNSNTQGTMTVTGDPENGISLSGQLDSYLMVIIPGATCNEDMAVRSQKNNFAILFQLAGSGVKCTNNGS